VDAAETPAGPPSRLRDGELPAPAELRFLADLIGDAATLALIELHGGTRVHVPRAPHEHSKLATEIGLPAARALAARWGGGDLKVPLARYWRSRIYRARGMTAAAIARRLGITEGQVWTYLRAAKPTDQPQLPLG
jgi:hypothetical protein